MILIMSRKNVRSIQASLEIDAPRTDYSVFGIALNISTLVWCGQTLEIQKATVYFSGICQHLIRGRDRV